MGQLVSCKADREFRMRDMSKQLQAGLVSLDAKSKARSEALILAQKAESSKCLQSMKDKIATHRTQLASDAAKYAEVREYDAQQVVPPNVLNEQLNKDLALAASCTLTAVEAAQQVREVNQQALESARATEARTDLLLRQFEADQLVYSQETELTRQSISKSPQQKDCLLHTSSQLRLEQEAIDRSEFDAIQERAMLQESKALALQVAERQE